MKRKRVLAATFFVSFCFAVSASAAVYKIQDGEVRFLARAKALKIAGEGAKPQGQISRLETETTGTVAVHLDDFKTGIGMRDDHMKNKYLHVKDHPDATLEIATVDLEQKTFKGILSLHGVKKEVQGEATVDLSGTKAEVKAQFRIRLSDFQIDPPSFMEIKLVDDVDVEVKMRLQEIQTTAQGSP